MNLVIAFIGGIITFVSPCVLPLIPIYIAYITGISVKDLKDSKSEKPLVRILMNSLFFVLGFTIIFSTLAALFYIFVQALGNYKIWFNRIAGAIIIIFGLHIIGIFKIKFLNFEAKFKTEVKKTGLIPSFLMGAAFGAGWTPCIGPILSGILFTGANSTNPWTAVTMLIVYSLGLGIPFILTGLLTNRLIMVFNVIKRNYRIIEIISGIFLVLLGLMLVFDWMGTLSGFFSRLLPGLGYLENKLIK